MADRRREMTSDVALRRTLQEAQACLNQGDLRGAEAAMKQAVALDGACVPALFNLGNLALDRGDAVEAAGWFERVLAVQRDLLPAVQNLGAARLQLGQLAEARAAFERILILDPGQAGACHNLGVVLMRLGQADEAEACFRRTLAADPGFTDATLNLAFLRLEDGAPAEAEALIRELLAREPACAAAHNTLGAMLEQAGADPEALAAYRRAAALEPASADLRFNLATHLLRMGHWEEGWAVFEARLQTQFYPPRSAVAPRWDGRESAGPLLVLAEQGLGDTLQFCRYLRELPPSLEPVFVVQPGLEGLLGRVPGAARVVACDLRAPLPEDFGCRFQIPLLSLPGLLGTREESIPSWIPYLHPSAERRAPFQAELAAVQGLRVGLVFAGNPGHLRDRMRSCPFAEFGPLLDRREVTFFSLQQGMAAAAVDGDFRIRDWAPRCLDPEDLAAALACLDLLMTVDTMPAHLAGALGKPTWILLDATPDWRWMRQRSDSPWYPTVRLFRQPMQGDWASVIRDVGVALDSLSPRTDP
ncbi:tetratricopeptide repeat protein [Geothrix sp. 21YS21S-4]|uniref:tetratricopeptide repeat protein n=1 Tax=Geothrix sp. 21YS21S-4 TaxID=3068889 RepID=UPI0027BAF63A|nr:tetratricopeptide repeat protein [Geothrix sp. 21YS21S-4]